jgi:hypothetical protein
MDKDFTKEKAAPLEKKAAQSITQSYTNPTGLSQQAIKVLSALRNGSMTSSEIYHDVGVIHPPARIYDLREAGFQILTIWDIDHLPAGDAHRVGRYVLIAEPASGLQKWLDCVENDSVLARFTIANDNQSQRERDLINWKKALTKNNPKFVKRFILGRLLDSGAIDDAGAAWLIEALNISEVQS